MDDGNITDPRAAIDAIDEEILRLLNRRTNIALQVGAAKTIRHASLCDSGREREVIDRLRLLNDGPLDDTGIANIFQRIIDESLHLQQERYHKPADKGPLEAHSVPGRSRVAFLGDRGTFSEEAVIALLGTEVESVSLPTFGTLFAAIDAGDADFILSPLENSLIGSVNQCVELLLASKLFIVAEIVLPISHFLIACREATMETIESVESHPAALGQCSRFFESHPHLTKISADDTAGSVRRSVESGDVRRAGIGGRRTAELYRGKILREHLEDDGQNFTRFVLLSQTASASDSGNKVSIVVRLKSEPGALHNALRPIVRRSIDMLKIESLPVKGDPKQFYFYIDLEAPAVEADLTGALDDLRANSEEVRFLGRYSAKLPLSTDTPPKKP